MREATLTSWPRRLASAARLLAVVQADAHPQRRIAVPGFLLKPHLQAETSFDSVAGVLEPKP